MTRAQHPHTTEPDVVGSGSDRPPRRRLRAAAAVLVLVAVGAYVGDSVQHRREVDQLAQRVAEARGTADYADTRVQSVIRYASPQLDGAATPAAVRAGLAQLVAQSARDQLRAVTKARGAVADVTVLPWHHSADTARTRCLRYLDARAQVLREGAAEPASLQSAHTDLTAVRLAARAALVGAGATPGSARKALGS